MARSRAVRSRPRPAQIYGSALDGVTIDGDFQLVGNDAVTVEDGLTLNGTATLGDSTGFGYLYFTGTQTLSGSGTVDLATRDPRNALWVPDSGTTLTIGAGITVHGQYGSIGYSSYFGGSTAVSIINQGTIAVDASGGYITIDGTGNQNFGSLEALNGATLSLQGSNWQDSGVNYADATSAFSIGASFSNSGNTLALTGPGTFTSSGTIQGGTVSVAAGTLLNLSGTLDGVTVNGNVQLVGNDAVTVEDGLTLNGTATLGDSTGFGYLYFTGTQTLSGSGTVDLATRDPRNALWVPDSGTTLTIGAGITVHGQYGSIGYSSYFGGSTAVSVINQGTIAVDASGGYITIDGTGNQNFGSLEALNGATLSLQGSNWQDSGVNYADATSAFSIGASFSNSGNTLALTGPGTFTSSGTIQGGTVSVAAGTLLNLSGTLDGVTVNGNVQVVGNNSVTVEDGLTLDGTATLGDSTGFGYLYFTGTQTLAGSGTVDLATRDSRNALWVPDSGTTLTIGAGFTVHGQYGFIGYSSYYGGSTAVSVINQGTIAADTSGGNITIYGTGNQNSGSLEALNGATLSLQGRNWQDSGVNYADATSAFSIGALFSNSGNTLALTGPGTFTSSGTIQGGTVSVAAGTLLNLSGTLDGVTVNGNVQVVGNDAVTVEDGLTLNGTATLGDSTGFGYLYFTGTQTLGGSGTVDLATRDSRNALWVPDSGTTLTIGAGITVHGQYGFIGYSSYYGGSTAVSVINEGTIAADTSGGNITIDGTGNQNSGSLEALNGATLSIQGTLTNTATVSVDSTSVLYLGGTLTGGTIVPESGAQIYGSTLDAVTINGDFQVVGDNNVTVEDGLTLNGTATLGDSTGYGYLYFTGTQTLSGSGTVDFATRDPRNALWVPDSGTILTIGAGITVHGQYGSIGYSSYYGGSTAVSVINQGTIAADTSGGNINVNASGAAFQNSGTVSASAGAINISAGSVGTVNSGTFSAGPAGTLNITGPYTQTSAGNFDEVLGGTTTGLYGQTLISGTASLNGTLNISEANGFSPNTGDVFTFLTYASETGQFANYSGLVLSGSAALEPAYSSTSATLTTVTDTTVAPDLRVTNLSINPANPQSSQSVTVNWDDFNAGNGSTGGPWTDHVVVTNTTTGETIATADVPYDATLSGAIAPNGSAAISFTFQLPNGPAGVGDLLVSVTTDYNHSIVEYYPGGVGYTNNTTTTTAVSTLAAYPDLQVSGLTVVTANPQSGQPVTVDWNDANSGNGPVSGSFSDYVTVLNSTTGQTVASRVIPYDEESAGPIDAGSSAAQQYTFNLPDGAPGVGQLVVTVTTNYDKQIYEFNSSGTAQTNNTSSVTTASTLAKYADLLVAPNSLTVTPSSPQSGGSVTVTWMDENQGDGAVSGAFSDSVLVQQVNGSSLTNITSGTVSGPSPLAAGATSGTQSFAFTLPDGAAGTGAIRVTVTTDSGQTIKEYDESGNPTYGNNTASTHVTSTFANYYTVNSTADTGPGSLREAIDEANANGGASTIALAISTGQQTIDLLSPLPAITAPVTIDGTTQPGYSGTPLIELDGAQAGAGATGLTLAGNDITVKALIISSFAGDGIEVTGSDALIESSYIGIDSTGTKAMGNGEAGVAVIGGGMNNTIGGTTAGVGNVISASAGDGVDLIDANASLIAGNWIGTNALGTAPLANAGDGVYVAMSSSVIIGGTSVGAGNLISGNNSSGVEINDSESTLVQGNLIGLDQTGTLAIGNRGAGVLIDDGSISSTIGAPVAGGRNFISGNAEGVLVTGSSTAGTDIAGNLIGTNVEGTAAVSNLTAGIVIAGGSGATIGGAAAVARNVISANAGDGIDVGSGAANTLVQGDYIGLDQTGTKPLGNLGSGVSLDAMGVTIGGAAQGAGNVISANAQAGVSIAGTDTTGVVILGNRIGTDYTGTAALGNGSFGVLVNGAPGVTIGGTASGDGNIISANPTAGIGLYAGATGALVQSNLIGTDITGSRPLGDGNGIQIDGGSSNNTIGGTAALAGNTIAFSTGIGVDVDATAGTGNEIRLNSIFSNTGLGIDLGGDGVTLNNSAGHTGPNDYQNFPVITAVTDAGGVTTVTGTLNSTPDTTFPIDFYTLSSLNASGYGEGRYILGSAPVTTDGSGNVSFVFQFPTSASGAGFVTATATDPGGNTSEFSQAFGFDLPPTAVIGFTSVAVDAGAAIRFDGLSSTDPSGHPLTYTWSFGDGGTATGPEPTHTYRSAGTDTLMLTVNDGFGGIDTATATVTVNDVPPVFTPNSYAPPLTYTTPAPGAGFGESVASNYGNVAIGAPSQSGTGAVYLYDGVTTANQSISTYNYGQLIHVFADPHPEPGDEFGASLAVVGNELVVGAPGSSLSGPGDGVAYVFDANDESTTFGALLATLTIPDPGASNDAQFGAAVGTTNTNIVIGAPGNDGGTGEAYEFEGDTTQPNFGAMLLDITNPDLQAGSRFGAAVAGIGNNLIVGAPSDNTAGAGTGTVYLFDGTTGVETAAIVNPQPAASTGFGASVASVGLDVLVGSPDDNSAGPGAGAAFLFDPSGVLLTTFVQPDGGGGHFGAAVAGTQNSALIGAPGANLGATDAGAAYVFDANPASPTFGLPIAAEEEPTPTTGDAFGTAVGFDDGALIAGATGAEAVQLYQPTAFLSLSSATTFATASYDSVILSGTFMDANSAVSVTASINWGDGSSATVINLPPGSYAFSVPHDYTTSPASGSYTIGVTLGDPHGETTFAQTTVAISNPAPFFASPGLVLSSSSIVEGGTETVSGTIKKPDGNATDTVSLDWGDGTAPTTIILPIGQDTFSTTHIYLQNPPGVASENYTIVGSAANQSGQVGYASASVTVNKVAPQFTAADLSLSKTTANEGDTITLFGQFTDPDAESSYTVTIDWGDGSTSTGLSELDGQIVQSATPGLYTYSITHQYLSIPPGQPTGGTYSIHVLVSDGVNTTSAGTSIVVNGVNPAVQITSSVDLGAGTITVTAGVTEPDPLATYTVAWTLTQNGIAIGMAAGTSYTFPIPIPLGMLVVRATATDTDGGMGSDSARMAPIDQTGASVVIDPSGITVSMGGVPISTIGSAGAGKVVVLVTGTNDLVNASAATSAVQLVSSGSNNTLIGGAGDDLLVAGSGANSLVGGTGDDTLVSDGGDDTLMGGAGSTLFQINPGHDPLVIGGSGTNTLDLSIAGLPVTLNLSLESGQMQIVDSNNDQLSLEGKFNEYIGSLKGNNVTLNDGNDLVYATTGNTTITGGSGSESIVGGSGNDIIYSTTGNDSITGGSGSETIVGGSGNDIIYSTTGNDSITGGSGSETIVGGSGNDIIYATTGNTTITGGSGSESITGGSGNDIIYSTTGNDSITGGSGSETIVGGSGNDIIYATTGNTTITGGSGSESITGGSGNDIIYSTTGNDSITGGSGSESITGGSGNDIIYATTGNTTITGGSGSESITGGSGNDIIYATTGNTTITGGSGSESITGGSGNDIIYATTGNDTITGGSGSESITGGSGNDIIYATTGNATITSGSGHESIVGGSGNDIIFGSTAVRAHHRWARQHLDFWRFGQRFDHRWSRQRHDRGRFRQRLDPGGHGQ